MVDGRDGRVGGMFIVGFCYVFIDDGFYLCSSKCNVYDQRNFDEVVVGQGRFVVVFGQGNFNGVKSSVSSVLVSLVLLCLCNICILRLFI